MDASTAQENPVVDPPRHLFFGVEDRRQGGRAGLNEKYLLMEKTRRRQLAEHVKATANQIISGVRTLEAFDQTGNADQALDHLNALREDLNKRLDNLTREVEESVDRYGDEMEKLAFRDIAAARAAADGQTLAPAPDLGQPAPMPGPVVSHLRIDGTPGPSPAAVAAQISARLDATYGVRA